MRSVIKYIVLGFMLIGGKLIQAQIVVNTDAPYNSADYLVRNILLGEGVVISNVTFNGKPEQIGYFSNTENIFGFPEGLIMSTGKVKEAQLLTNNCGSSEFKTGGDGDCLKVAQLVKPEVNITYDAAILEFDFYLESDSISFRYTFGSEEYLKYANTKYCDVFGFFVSGPGITGPYSSPAAFPGGSINIALIPGTSYPISVTTVNDSANSQYYVPNGDNKDRICTDADPAAAKIEFNGYTRTFTASMKVQSCQTYHIKLAIADGSKSDFDSGVMLEARSFSSNNLQIEQSLGFVFSDTLNPEGCSSPSVTLTRLSDASRTDTILISADAASQATMTDIDLPGRVVFLPGEVEKKLSFNVLEDGLTEGIEKLLLNFAMAENCVDKIYRSSFYLVDAAPLAFIKPNDEDIVQVCIGDTVELDGAAKNGYGFYKYRWSKDGTQLPDTGNSIRVFPSGPSQYTVTVSDTCNMQPVTKSFRVTPPDYKAMEVYVKDSALLECSGDELILQPDSVVNGAGYYTYRWHLGKELIGSSASVPTNPEKEGYYSLTVRDSCGAVISDSIYVKIRRYPPIIIETIADTTICSGDSVTLRVSATGGAGGFTYFWETLQSNDTSVVIYPKMDAGYPVTVQDKCRKEKSASVNIDVNEIKADFEIDYSNDFDLIVENYSIGNIIDQTWYFDREFFSSEKQPVISLTDLDEHSLLLKIVDAAGCRDSLEKAIRAPLMLYIPNTFTPNQDGINDLFRVFAEDVDEFELRIFDRWGEEIFFSNDPGSSWNGVHPSSGKILSGVYTVQVKAVRDKRQRINRTAMLILLQ